ncbi:MAG: PilT/PilU family type 4a pilus ATPase [Planctomycetes bacterium]|nr:PilT/PilU family type 4a pilus ATPase [Planctomycetota bacterium]
MNTLPDASPPAEISADLARWLSAAVTAGASDLHLIADYPPTLRVHGELQALTEPALESASIGEQLRALCPPALRSLLDTRKSVDFSFDLESGGRKQRFRGNLFYTANRLAGCFRIIPAEIPEFRWAGFPQPLAERLAFLPDGLVIVTGVTGSGKTTTLAMIVNLLNQAGGYRIITVEDPVEYLYPRSTDSVITQRELGTDVESFADGLKFGLRQDPDVILVGEIRDRETAQMALSAAETGHLVFTTLHTRDVKGAISRFADLFPQDVQSDVRSQLALSLRAIISQRLLPGYERGAKRHLALEVLWNTHPIATGIRQGKLESIDNYLMTHRSDGMISFDESVRQLYLSKKISRETAEQNVREASILHR